MDALDRGVDILEAPQDLEAGPVEALDYEATYLILGTTDNLDAEFEIGTRSDIDDGLWISNATRSIYSGYV